MATLRAEQTLSRSARRAKACRFSAALALVKPAAVGPPLAKAYLRAGFGGLVLCAKKDEMATWQRYAEETGRSDSVLIFDASGDYRFPFLQYEVNREGEGAGYTENLVRLFMTVYEAVSRSSGSGADPYWRGPCSNLCGTPSTFV